MPTYTSLSTLQDAVCFAPESGAALHELGTAMLRRGELTDAIRFRRAAARVHPGYDTHLWLGWLSQRMQDFDAAERSYRDALAIAPHAFRASGALGELYAIALDRPADAIACCVEAIRVDPEGVNPYVSLCRALERDSPDETITRAERLLPPDARRDLLARAFGMALVQVGQYVRARIHLDREVQRDPLNGRLHALLGRITHAMGDDEIARGHFEAARSHPGRRTKFGRPEEAEHVEQELMRYAWRTGDRGFAKSLLRGEAGSASAPSWNAVFAGETILVVNDDYPGYGNTIRWSRIAPLLRASGARVVLECRVPLQPVLLAADGVNAAVVPHDEYPQIDRRCSVLDLLSRYDDLWQRLEGPAQSVNVPASDVRRWRTRIAASGAAMVHVGVDWSPCVDIATVEEPFAPQQDPYTCRAIPIDCLQPLTRLPGVICHALPAVAGPRTSTSALPREFIPLANGFDSFMELAAALSSFDVLVTADTTTAHLGGALGKPTLLMLPYYADWRWGDRDASFPWYPSVHRFQQRSPGDWTSVVEEVAKALTAMIRTQADLHPGERSELQPATVPAD